MFINGSFHVFKMFCNIKNSKNLTLSEKFKIMNYYIYVCGGVCSIISNFL